VVVGERGLVALTNVRNGEKLLFVPPSLVITADSVTMILASLPTVTTPLRTFSCAMCCSVVPIFRVIVFSVLVCRNGPTVRWGK
jgi:hypothetical protein